MLSVNPVLAQTQGTRRPIDAARAVLAIEIEGLSALDQRLTSPPSSTAFENAISVVLACKGRVVVSGIGKSGHIARKIAATLASTGTPAFFVHPAEALHGDLGMVTAGDVFIALSNSGEAEELLAIVPVLKRQGAILLAITGNSESRLAQHADIHLNAGVPREACPLNLAPTASTTAQLALGDALAVALLEARGFGREDFARSHPGGTLGRRLLTHVRDVMRTGDAIPQVALTATLPEAILEMSRKRMGMTAVLAADRSVAGIFTDGDLRRLLERTLDLSKIQLEEAITREPLSISPNALAAEAADLLDRHRRNQLLVIDNRQLVGALHVHDLMAAKVI